MSNDLQTLLRDHAAAVSFDPVDVHAVELEGARAVRRRTRVRLIGVLAAVLLIGSATAFGVLRGSDHTPQPAGSPPPAGLSWAEGSVIHLGSTSVDVGRPVTRYVVTTGGIVFTDGQGVVWSWRNGTATSVGHTPGPLFAVAGQPLAGWVQQNSDHAPVSFVVLNQAIGRTQEIAGQSRPGPVMAPGEFSEEGFVGLDGTHAWWLDGRHFYRDTLPWKPRRASANRTAPPAPPHEVDLPPDLQLLAASNEVLIEQNHNSGDVTAVRRGQTVGLHTALADSALLSPDGRYVAFGTDEGSARAQVFDTTTGHRLSFEPTAWSALITQWLTNQTVAVLVAIHETDHYRLETCSIRTTVCSVAVPDLGSGPRTGPGNGLRFRLPTGDYWFPYLHG